MTHSVSIKSTKLGCVCSTSPLEISTIIISEYLFHFTVTAYLGSTVKCWQLASSITQHETHQHSIATTHKVLEILPLVHSTQHRKIPNGSFYVSTQQLTKLLLNSSQVDAQQQGRSQDSRVWGFPPALRMCVTTRACVYNYTCAFACTRACIQAPTTRRSSAQPAAAGGYGTRGEGLGSGDIARCVD